MLRISNLNRRFGDFELKDVSFEIAEGEYFVLLGPSGVGKTLLLEMIAGLHRPDSGQIFYKDLDLTHEKIQRRGLALVYQDQALFPHLTARKNIGYGLRSKGKNRARINTEIESLADEVGITDFLDQRPGILSGGEAQRIALARALATEPRCLLLDEPLCSLDARSRGEIRALLRRLNRQGNTMLHVTHDYEEAIALASRVAVMDSGGIVQIGEPQEIFRHPKSEFVASFIGIKNFFKGNLTYPDSKSGLAEFQSAGPIIRILTDLDAGSGYCMVRSEDITITAGKAESSAQNAFEGIVVDIAPAKLGVEVTIDIGIELACHLSAESTAKLGLACGLKIWVNFKASAVKFLQE